MKYSILLLLLLWRGLATAQLPDEPELNETQFAQLDSATLVTSQEPLFGAPRTTKKALIIGVADYAFQTKLNAPVNDARAIASLLRQNGWLVHGYENLQNKNSFEKAVSDFSKLLEAEDQVLVYYSGHGFQWNQANYLVPKMANIRSGADITSQAYPMSKILAVLNQKKCRVKLIFLDACRNNLNESLKKIKNLQMGMKIMVADGDIKVEPTKPSTGSENLAFGTMVAYAAAPGKPALEGNQYSLFTGALYSVLAKTPCMSITDALQTARGKVIAKTKQQQVPWENSSLTGKVTIKSCAK